MTAIGRRNFPQICFKLREIILVLTPTSFWPSLESTSTPTGLALGGMFQLQLTQLKVELSGAWQLHLLVPVLTDQFLVETRLPGAEPQPNLDNLLLKYIDLL